MIRVGDQFGALTVVSVTVGAKSVHPLARCRCACGREQKVRQTHLRTGARTACRQCRWREAWKGRPRAHPDAVERGEAFSHYKQNARQKNREWSLDRESFDRLYDAACTYCGVEPSRGVDRIDNHSGYTPSNSASCCTKCNYAKRDMTVGEFLSWVSQVHRFSCDNASRSTTR